MLEQFNYLQEAKDFIDRGEYGKAIELLENYEQLVVNANSKGFLQIKINLIDAYAGDGQIDRAISISEKLANNSNLEIKTWAKEKLKLLTKSGDESLEDNTSDRESSDNSNFKSERQESATENETTETPPKQLLNREEAEKFLKEGNQFFRQKNYPEAIENLEKFCQGTKTNHPNRFNALRNLVKAYQQNQQLEKAIALCTLMSSESQETIKIWGQQFLNTLASATAIETSSTTSNSDSHTNRVAIEQPKPTKIKLKTLAEFKEYCRNNLVGDLKYFETKRKQSLRAIIVAILHLTFGFAYVVKRMIKGEKLDIKRFREEIILQKVTRHNIFKGLFFQADFNKTFACVTWIVPNDVCTKVKFLSSSQEVKLEDSEFNRLFKVYSTSQVEARYILSTNLISKIVDFSKRINKKVYISFVRGKIYIAIKYDRDLFEPRLYQNMLSIAPIKEYFESIQLMLSIAQELNLNRKIWAKE